MDPNRWIYPRYESLTIFDTEENFPGPRCGHTLTAVGHRLFLFGGSTTVMRDGDFPLPDISLEGVTNSLHCFNTFSRNWTRVNTEGEVPSPRAGHAAATFGTKLVIQGGIGPSGLSTGDLYIVDMNDDKFEWHRVEVEGEGPGPRYGHAMDLANRWLVIFGGKRGNQIFSDAWALDMTQKAYAWERLNPEGDPPSGRMYASGTARNDGLFFLCGGRDYLGPLADAYALERHRDGQWVWSRVPGIASTERAQHAAAFERKKLHVIGGCLSRGCLIGGEGAVAVLDTTPGKWLGSNEPGTSNQGVSSNAQNCDQLTQRCHHAAASAGSRIYVHGGFKEDVLLGDFLVADTWEYEPPVLSNMSSSSSENSMERLAEDCAKLPTVETAFYALETEGYLQRPQRTVAVSEETVENRGGLVRQQSLDRYENQGYTPQFPEIYTGQGPTQDLHKMVISTLLIPVKDWKPPATRIFFLSYYQVEELCSAAERIIAQEPTVLELKVPIKVFGDIHGQFGDLMRLFYEFGSPSMEGEITYTDFLFLGDYVDRGRYSLETIILLLALKIEYPNNIHLIRGNHECSLTNTVYGFRDECVERMGPSEGVQAWYRINELFSKFPLAALIEDKIFCMHGGIGKAVQSVEDVARIERPIYPESESRVVKELLWSDPTANDSVLGITDNPRGEKVVSFGPDIVKAFCERNKIDLIIRAHECVMDGFERFAAGQLITVFSATNYCGTVKNAGAILMIGRDFKVVAKLIHPNPPALSPSEIILDDSLWMEEVNTERPPTPPRGRPYSTFERGSTSSS